MSNAKGSDQISARHYKVIAPIFCGMAGIFICAAAFPIIFWRREAWNPVYSVGFIGIAVMFCFSAVRCRRLARRIESPKAESQQNGEIQQKPSEVNPWFVVALLLVGGLTTPFIPNLATLVLARKFPPHVVAHFWEQAGIYIAAVRACGIIMLILGMWVAVRQILRINPPGPTPDGASESN
jgi:hypothetical protein